MNDIRTPVIASTQQGMNPAKQSSLQEDDTISVLDILEVLAENARLLVFGPLIVGLAALAWSYTITPTFTASTRIMTPQQQQSVASALLSQMGAFSGMAAAAYGYRDPADMYVSLIQSRTIADRIVERFKLMEKYETDSREAARNNLMGSTTVSAGKDGLITITVVDPDPKHAAAVANAYVEELTRLMGSLAVTEAQQRRLFFEKELARTKENLVRAEVALGGTGVSESLLKFNPETMGEGIVTLRAQVVAKEVQLASMRGYLTENSPDFRQARQELTALRAQLAKAGNNPPAGGNADYINRYREFKYFEVLFEQLARQYEVAKIDESREGKAIQVVDAAEPPERKSKPQKAKIAILYTLASGFALLLFVFVRRAIQNAGKNPESAAKLAAVRAGVVRVVKF
jgi:tyrosine-protein kinase Etk/Wzc